MDTDKNNKKDFKKKSNVPVPLMKRIFKEVIQNNKRISEKGLKDYGKLLKIITLKVALESEKISNIKGKKTITYEDIDIATQKLIGLKLPPKKIGKKRPKKINKK